MKKNKKTPSDEIKQLKDELIANSKDARWAKQQLSRLISLQKQEDIEPSELTIPIKEIKDEANADSFRIVRTIRGYLFQTRGGALSTFVELKYHTVCSLLDSLMTLVKKSKEGQLEDFEQSYFDCISYVMQAPIFAAMGLSLPAYNKPAEHDSLFNIGIAILKEFNRFTEVHFTEAKAADETESDIEANDIHESLSQVIENTPE